MYHSKELYSNCDLIDASQVIATAKMRIGLDTNQHDLWFEVELENTLKKFGSLGTVTVLTRPVTIEDRKIKLPRGIRRFIGIRHDFCLDPNTVTSTGQPNVPVYLFTRGFLLGYNDCGDFYDYYTLKDGYIHLRTSDFDGLDVTLCYEGYNTDDNGNIRFYDVYESALAWYLCHLFTLVEPYYYGNDPYLTERKSNAFLKKYQAEKAKIRGDEQRTQWKNDRIKMDLIQDKVQISDYRLYWTY